MFFLNQISKLQNIKQTTLIANTEHCVPGIILISFVYLHSLDLLQQPYKVGSVIIILQKKEAPADLCVLDFL